MKKWFMALLLSSVIAFNPACKSKSEHKADEKNVIQTNEVPEIVKNAFNSKYPGATEMIWEDAHEGDSPTIKVKFKKDGKYWKAEFKGDGTFVKEKED